MKTNEPLVQFTNRLETMQTEEPRLMHKKPSSRPRNLNPDKKVQAQVKISSMKQNNDDTELTLPEVEEVSPRQIPKLNLRSKKISKASKRK